MVKSTGDAAITSDRMLYLAGKGAKATGRETPEGIVVIAGSLARLDEVESIHAFGTSLRQTLIESGVLRADAGHYVFTRQLIRLPRLRRRSWCFSDELRMGVLNGKRNRARR